MKHKTNTSALSAKSINTLIRQDESEDMAVAKDDPWPGLERGRFRNEDPVNVAEGGGIRGQGNHPCNQCILVNNSE